jgi:hypothetical protein
VTLQEVQPFHAAVTHRLDVVCYHRSVDERGVNKSREAAQNEDAAHQPATHWPDMLQKYRSASLLEGVAAATMRPHF